MFRDIGKDECWTSIKAFHSEKGFVDHQLRTWDYFVTEDIPEIIEETLPLVYVTPNILGPQQKVDDVKSLVMKEATHIVHVFRFCPNAKVGYPTISYVDSDPRPITPTEARIEKQNYAAPVTMTICHETYAYHKRLMPEPVALDVSYETHCIGMMPIMVGSVRCWTKHPNQPKSVVSMKECPYDTGGYFIINGVEKVLISQEHMRQNIINVFTRRPSGKAILVAEVRSARNRLRGSVSPLNLKTLKQCSLLQPTEVTCQIYPYIKSEIPIFLLFRALGFDDFESLKILIGSEFYQTFDVDFIKHRLTEQPEEIDRQLVKLINECCKSCDSNAKNTEEAKMWLAKRAHQPYADETWQSQKKNDKRKRKGKTQEDTESNDVPAKKLFKSIDEILTRDLLPHLTPPELLKNRSPLSEESPIQDESIAKKKLMFLLHMLGKLWRVQLGLEQENDRDNNAHKRFDAAGPLFAQLFTQHYYKMIKDVRKYLSRCALTGKPLSFAAGIKTKTVTHGMIYACSTGNWPNQKSATPHTGVSQTLNRMNFNAFLSHGRRYNTPIDKTNSKLTGPRALHETSWGSHDPSETPEGEPCGLVKNMALLALITIGHDCAFLRRYLDKENIVPLNQVIDSISRKVIRDPMAPPLPKKRKLQPVDWDFESLSQMTRVYLNGEWLGYHRDGRELTNRLKHLRRRNLIPYEAAIVLASGKDHSSVLHISLEAGRTCYPVFLVERYIDDQGVTRNRLALKQEHVSKLQRALTTRYGWDDLIKDGVVEYLDSFEKEFAIIAAYQVDLYKDDAPAYTHCEIDPSVILGVSSGQIPFCNSNQAARNTFQCAMGKQAMGTPGTNSAHRTDTISYQLWYPQTPLVSTRAGKHMMHNDVLAAGINVVFAITSYTGYNQDDSLILSQSAIDLGMFRSSIYRSIYVDTKKQPSNSFETFEKPDPNEVVGMRHHNYDKIDEDGFAAPGTYIEDGDVIIGKTQPPPANVAKQAKNKYRGGTLGNVDEEDQQQRNDEELEQTKKSCRSVVHNGKPCYVSNVVTGNTPQGGRYGRVTTVETHVPAISDKFSSRHGQKGTCGMAYSREDMPFSMDGISPDVIMNPHGMTSRMTIGQLKEGIFGMVAACSGKIMDGTPFYEFYGIDTSGKTEEEVDQMLFSPNLKEGQTLMDAVYDMMAFYGFERKGKQQLFDGRTGEMFECETFMTLVYYQPLRHLGSEKKHARARGRRQTITKQPAEGRSRDGGLRFGEMERDAVIAHGASNLLVERLHYNSDPSDFYVCDSCGSIGVGEAFIDEKSGTEYTLARCTYCVHSTMKPCKAPNALKSLFQELGGANINSSIWV